MMTPPRMIAFALVVLLAGPAETRAGFAYGVTLLDNQLISVDTTTGAGTLVGPLGMPMNPFGLASVNNRLYAFDSNADVIRQLDPSSGGIQASYSIGLAKGTVVGQGGLAFQSSTVGFLTSALDPVTLNPTNYLYRFDIGTGKSTLFATTPESLEALAFDSAGVLYGLGRLDGNLYKINTTSGASTLVGSSGLASIGSPTGGLAFGPGGTLYATFDDALYTLNTANGLATAVNPDPTANTGFSSISGLAFASTVPEPSSLALSGIFAALAGGYGLVRRRKAA